jgi:hypothetical protein
VTAANLARAAFVDPLLEEDDVLVGCLVQGVARLETAPVDGVRERVAVRRALGSGGFVFECIDCVFDGREFVFDFAGRRLLLTG